MWQAIFSKKFENFYFPLNYLPICGPYSCKISKSWALHSLRRHKILKDKHIKILLSLVQLLLTSNGPGHSGTAIQVAAKASGQIPMILMMVCNKIRLGQKIEQHIVKCSQQRSRITAVLLSAEGIRQLTAHDMLSVFAIP